MYIQDSRSHPYFIEVVPRALTPRERGVVERLLWAAPGYAGELPGLRVVGRCGCGACPTIFFRAAPGGSERDVAHFIGKESDGGITGVVLLAGFEGLSQLEFYSLDGHDPWGIPEVGSLVPTVAQHVGGEIESADNPEKMQTSKSCARAAAMSFGASRLNPPVRALVISTDGYCLEAVVEIRGARYTLMDEFSPEDHPSPPGLQIELNMTWQPDDAESWDDVVKSNPGQRKGLVQLEGWRYQALGQVVTVDPVVVDCGILRAEGVLSSKDQRLVGEWVGFKIARLGGASAI